MAWVAVDKDGNECVYQFRPIKKEIDSEFIPRYEYSMWIARDSDGSLWLYNAKPVKDESVWLLSNSMGVCCNIEDDFDSFSEIKWEDEEPRELLLKLIN